jgi:hypothetical protein
MLSFLQTAFVFGMIAFALTAPKTKVVTTDVLTSQDMATATVCNLNTQYTKNWTADF